MSKITIIGAGNVGATAAQFIAMKELCDEIVLLDVRPEYAEGKAIDISQALLILNSKTVVSGYTNDYKPTENSDIIVITSGVPRKPGMTREELVTVNSGVVKSVVESSYKYSPNAIYIIVSNPLDTMTYLAVKYLEKLDKKNVEQTVFGMGGVLDSARYNYYQLHTKKKFINTYPKFDEVHGIVVGGHGDKTMIPLSQTLPHDGFSLVNIASIFDNTRNGGATLTKMLGTSAWMAPAAAICKVVSDIVTDNLENTSSQCVYREEHDCCIGSLVRIGRKGVIAIETGYWEELDVFKNSINLIKEINKAIPNL